MLILITEEHINRLDLSVVCAKPTYLFSLLDYLWVNAKCEIIVGCSMDPVNLMKTSSFAVIAFIFIIYFPFNNNSSICRCWSTAYFWLGTLWTGVLSMIVRVLCCLSCSALSEPFGSILLMYCDNWEYYWLVSNSIGTTISFYIFVFPDSCIYLRYLFFPPIFIQCGQGNTKDQLRPSYVNSLSNSRVKTISAGLWHTLCISVDGRVHAFGGNQFGQLGTGADEAEVRSTTFLFGFLLFFID